MVEGTLGRHAILMMSLAIDTTLAIRATAIRALAVTTVGLVVHVLRVVGVRVIRMLWVGVRGLLLLDVRLRLRALTRSLLLVLTNRIGGIMPAIVGFGICAARVAGLLSRALGVLTQIIVLRGIVGAEWAVISIRFPMVLSALLVTVVCAVSVSALLIGSVVRRIIVGSRAEGSACLRSRCLGRGCREAVKTRSSCWLLTKGIVGFLGETGRLVAACRGKSPVVLVT